MPAMRSICRRQPGGTWRVLCVDVTNGDVPWQTPGGAVEPGETLPETARKETREETGIEIALTGLADTRWVEILYDDAVPETVVLPMAVFTADPVGGALESGGNTLPDGRDEITDVAWFEPGTLPEGTLDREWLVEYCEAG
jgi:8-oxo-dGTP pyrophosphatase MutT (NUDIX family)